MQTLELLIVIVGLISAGLGLATAYINLRAAQKLIQSQKREQRRLWPW